MEYGTAVNLAAAIAYIEAHMDEPLDLAAVAGAAHYSKYHLHHIFTATVGMTPHDYIRRRRLTEAAKQLVFSGRPLSEIALTAGYGSQQAFTGVFKAMYKQTPLAYREGGRFYPLQWEVVLHGGLPLSGAAALCVDRAAPRDIPAWMGFVSHVIGGFPCLDEAEHLERLRYHIGRGQVLVVRDGDAVAAGAAFSPRTGQIHFLGVHPQYRRYGLGRMLVDFMADRVSPSREIRITTFRQGDRADTGQRTAYRQLGFAPARLSKAFGYPTQQMVLRRQREGAPHV